MGNGLLSTGGATISKYAGPKNVKKEKKVKIYKPLNNTINNTKEHQKERVTMAVQYNVFLESKNGEISVTRTFNNTSHSDIITPKIATIQEKCQHFNWNQPNLSKEIGTILFTIVNGDNQLLPALKEADLHGEPLHLYIHRDSSVPDLPFELLYHSQFLVPSKIHVIRQVTEYGQKKKVESKNRPLKVLFMACSPLDVPPVLDFEKEEETILEVTKDLPVDIDVEDTGSLQGLKECLKHFYDVIHVSGHADIDEKGPLFLMEDETGYPVPVRPSELWDAIQVNPPHLLFLSGCRTGEAPAHEAAVSFAHELVVEHSPTVLGWGLKVSDPGARIAGGKLYFELSRGKSILDAVLSARRELYDNKWPDWSLLRLFSDGTPLGVPLVEKGQKKTVKARDIQYAYLLNSQVKVLKKGFVGRRRQIQRGIRTLKNDEEKIGLLLHGTGGLGKSCLAGKFCDRFKDYALVIVKGELNAMTFLEGLEYGLARAEDQKGLQILQAKEEVVKKIMLLCSTSFREKKYLIVLDDFEENLKGFEQGDPVLSDEAVPILGMLLYALPLVLKRTQLIITSRYTFDLVLDGKDLVSERLESIGLTSFQGADERKKVADLEYIREYSDEDIRKKLIEAGRGNPRLMEALNALLQVEQDVDISALLQKVEGKQEEFVQDLVLREILHSQSEEFQKVIKYSAVFGLPVLREGLNLVCNDVDEWDTFVDTGVQLGLMEENKIGDMWYYWVTPLLREEVFGELSEEEKMFCHTAAVVYYRKVLSLMEGYSSLYASELIEHALKCGKEDIALEEGGILLKYLGYILAYAEALQKGEYILSQLQKLERDENFARFLFEFGVIYESIGDSKKAVDYFEKALEIDREVYGEKHPDVATMLSNLGLAWDSLGDSKKAIEYFEKALKIDREVYGEKHPDVATRLNNLGGAWKSLGDYKKAIDYFEKALKIDREVYGEKHPSVATYLNNLGSAWLSLGDYKKAIDYFEKALKIDREVYGDKHPDVATDLNNLGGAWDSLGDYKKAIEYYEKALKIDREVYGEKHPDVATDLNNLGSAWDSLGDYKKAIDYFEKALKIDREVYGEKHPDVATRLNNLGGAWKSLGDYKKAIEYYEKALKIDREVYGEKHPDVATRLNNLGSAWDSLGDYKKAIEYFEKALKIVTGIYGETHPYVASTLNNLGSAWLSLGEYKKAIKYTQQAYTICQEVLGDQHPNTKIVKENLEAIKSKNK
jgi:tetratricopeptide (TPR) repeat protein